MGDCGTYKASIYIEYSLRKKDKNTEEECLRFIDKNSFTITDSAEVSETNIRELYKQNTKFYLRYEDWEVWESSFMPIDDMLEALRAYEDISSYHIETVRTATVQDIEYMDLELAKDVSSISPNLRLRTDEIMGLWESIYCETDNSSCESKPIKDIEHLLKLPDAKLVLEGDGSGNC